MSSGAVPNVLRGGLDVRGSYGAPRSSSAPPAVAEDRGALLPDRVGELSHQQVLADTGGPGRSARPRAPRTVRATRRRVSSASSSPRPTKAALSTAGAEAVTAAGREEACARCRPGPAGCAGRSAAGSGSARSARSGGSGLVERGGRRGEVATCRMRLDRRRPRRSRVSARSIALRAAVSASAGRPIRNAAVPRSSRASMHSSTTSRLTGSSHSASSPARTSPASTEHLLRRLAPPSPTRPRCTHGGPRATRPGRCDIDADVPCSCRAPAGSAGGARGRPHLADATASV